MKFDETEITKVFKDETPGDGIKRFPVKLKSGYVPNDPAWPKDPRTGFPQKALKGEEVSIPIDEARRLIKLGLAERNDGIEI